MIISVLLYGAPFAWFDVLANLVCERATFSKRSVCGMELSGGVCTSSPAPRGPCAKHIIWVNEPDELIMRELSMSRSDEIGRVLECGTTSAHVMCALWVEGGAPWDEMFLLCRCRWLVGLLFPGFWLCVCGFSCGCLLLLLLYAGCAGCCCPRGERGGSAWGVWSVTHSCRGLLKGFGSALRL